MAEELRQTKDLIQQTNAKKLCYGIYDDACNNLNISSLLKFKFCLTDNLMINEINTVWHDTGRSLDTTWRLVSGTFILFQL
jgi:hypothetical protein